MSGGYGRAYDARLSGGAADATYPNKYLQSGWPQRRMEGRVGAKRAATISLSLLFPVFVLLMISIAFREEDNAAAFSAQSAIHVAGYSLAALAVLFALGGRRLRLDPWMFVCSLVPIFIAATALYAPEPSFSLAAGMAHLALLLFAWRMVTRHGHLNAVFAFILAGTIICGLSIVAYYAFPDLGRSTVDVLNADPGDRMRGVTSQPNSLGLISAVTALLAVLHFKAFARRQRMLAVIAFSLSAFCLAYSDSRTAILALVICLAMWWLCRANAALNLFTIVGVALAAALVIAFVPDVTAYLTREGARSDDLTSLNGRSYIWQVAWEHIKAHPLLGEGYGSSRLVLPIDDRLFAAAVNTHNLYLELLFSGGIVLLGLFVVGVTAAIVRSAAHRRVEALILLLFFLVSGATASSSFGGLPLFPSAALYMALSLCLARSMARPQAAGYMPSVMAHGRALTSRTVV